MRRRDPDLSLDSQGGGQIAPPLALAFETAGGRQKLQCWNTQGIFRLIQSIPSPKAEPFKRWLAKVGKERLDEIENPELAMGRMQELYEKKGYVLRPISPFGASRGFGQRYAMGGVDPPPVRPGGLPESLLASTGLLVPIRSIQMDIHYLVAYIDRTRSINNRQNDYLPPFHHPWLQAHQSF